MRRSLADECSHEISVTSQKSQRLLHSWPSLQPHPLGHPSSHRSSYQPSLRGLCKSLRCIEKLILSALPRSETRKQRYIPKSQHPRTGALLMQHSASKQRSTAGYCSSDSQSRTLIDSKWPQVSHPKQLHFQIIS